MNDFLSLSDHLLARARLMLRIGRSAESRRLLRRVLVHSDLPPQLRAEVLRLLAGIEFDLGRFHLARRLLATAIKQRRNDTELYVEYAGAVLADPDAHPRIAVNALRRAVGIDPSAPRLWAALGTAAIRAGNSRIARTAFRRAAGLQLTSDILGEIVTGYVALDCIEEARVVLTAARCQSPKDPGVKAVWDKLRFTVVHDAQVRERHEEPMVLKFAALTEAVPVSVRSRVLRRLSIHEHPSFHANVRPAIRPSTGAVKRFKAAGR